MEDAELTELERFILRLDDEIKRGARAEQALRAIVVDMAERIREQKRRPV